ncbi:membrane protein [Staphylococcus phage S-CoN_Ph11]|nr:membrane protein [Staphylococcus phage S-CoN_Ph11]
MKVHESNKSYVKKTIYTVSKKSKLYFLTGYRELDTKYDVYIKK